MIHRESWCRFENREGLRWYWWGNKLTDICCHIKSCCCWSPRGKVVLYFERTSTNITRTSCIDGQYWITCTSWRSNPITCRPRICFWKCDRCGAAHRWGSTCSTNIICAVTNERLSHSLCVWQIIIYGFYGWCRYSIINCTTATIIESDLISRWHIVHLNTVLCCSRRYLNCVGSFISIVYTINREVQVSSRICKCKPTWYCGATWLCDYMSNCKLRCSCGRGNIEVRLRESKSGLKDYVCLVCNWGRHHLTNINNHAESFTDGPPSSRKVVVDIECACTNVTCCDGVNFNLWITSSWI